MAKCVVGNPQGLWKMRIIDVRLPDQDSGLLNANLALSLILNVGLKLPSLLLFFIAATPLSCSDALQPSKFKLLSFKIQ